MKPAVYHCVTTLEAAHVNNTPNSNQPATEPVAFDARTQRVLELRRQIIEGTYEIDHHAIAAAILGEHLAIDAALAPASPANSGPASPIRDFSRFVVIPTPAPAPVNGEGVCALTA